MAVQKMMLCIELVNITFKQGKLGWNEMYLQVVDKVEWISWGNKRPMDRNVHLRKYGEEDFIFQSYDFIYVFSVHCTISPLEKGFGPLFEGI